MPNEQDYINFNLWEDIAHLMCIRERKPIINLINGYRIIKADLENIAVDNNQPVISQENIEHMNSWLRALLSAQDILEQYLATISDSENKAIIKFKAALKFFINLAAQESAVKESCIKGLLQSTKLVQLANIVSTIAETKVEPKSLNFSVWALEEEMEYNKTYYLSNILPRLPRHHQVYDRELHETSESKWFIERVMQFPPPIPYQQFRHNSIKKNIETCRELTELSIKDFSCCECCYDKKKSSKLYPISTDILPITEAPITAVNQNGRLPRIINLDNPPRQLLPTRKAISPAEKFVEHERKTKDVLVAENCDTLSALLSSTKLKKLILDTSCMTNADLLHIVEKCPYLNLLVIANPTKHNSERSHNNISAVGLEHLNKLSYLTHLVLNNLNITVEALINLPTSITHLVVTDYPLFDKTTLQNVVSSLPNLQLLRLNRSLLETIKKEEVLKWQLNDLIDNIFIDTPNNKSLLVKFSHFAPNAKPIDDTQNILSRLPRAKR